MKTLKTFHPPVIYLKVMNEFAVYFRSSLNDQSEYILLIDTIITNKYNKFNYIINIIQIIDCRTFLY